MSSEGDNTNKLITVKYYSDEGIVDERTFEPNSRFKDIIDYFNNESPKKDILKTKDRYLLNNRLIRPTEPVKNLIHVNKDNSLGESEIWLEVEEPGLSVIEEEPYMNKIIKPKLNPFGLAIYRPETGGVSIEDYPEGIIKKYGLDNFNYTSAYCDSKDFLFISGGENNGVISQDFWMIEHKNYRIRYKKMPYPKKNHSMIYIPEGFLFIVGGNDERTFYYDPKYDEFIDCGMLNAVHFEPALFRYHDWLYCFNSLINEIEFFERTSVTRFSGKWEKVLLSYDSEEAAKFDNKFFGVCKTTKDRILFIGGRDTDANSFVFNPQTNRISVAEGKDRDVELYDKKFYPVDTRYSIAIPKYFEEDHDLAVVDKINRSLKTAHLDEGKSQRIIKPNLVNIPSEGDLFVKAKVNCEEQQKITTLKSLGPKSKKIQEGLSVSNNWYQPNKIYKNRLIPSKNVVRQIDPPRLSQPVEKKVSLQLKEPEKEPEESKNSEIFERETVSLVVPEVQKKEETGQYALIKQEEIPAFSEDGKLKSKRAYTFQKPKDIFNPNGLRTLTEEFKEKDMFEIEKPRLVKVAYPNIGDIDLSKFPKSRYNREKKEIENNEPKNETVEKQSAENKVSVKEEPILLRGPQTKNSKRKLILPPKNDLAQPTNENESQPLTQNLAEAIKEEESSSEDFYQNQQIEEPVKLVKVENKLKEPVNLISVEEKKEPVTLVNPEKKLKTVNPNTKLKSQVQNKNMILFRDTLNSRVGSTLPNNYPQKKSRVSQTAFCDYKL